MTHRVIVWRVLTKGRAAHERGRRELGITSRASEMVPRKRCEHVFSRVFRSREYGCRGSGEGQKVQR